LYLKIKKIKILLFLNFKKCNCEYFFGAMFIIEMRVHYNIEKRGMPCRESLTYTVNNCRGYIPPHKHIDREFMFMVVS
ncbi:MAG: hypothetical protein ACP5OE_09575, partial [Thermodesulfobium sp.]